MMNEQSFRAGDVVFARRQRWRVVSIRPYPACKVVALTGASRTNAGRTAHVVTPFDDIEPAVRPRAVRLVSTRALAAPLPGADCVARPCGPPANGGRRADRSAAAPARAGPGDRARACVPGADRRRSRPREDDPGGTDRVRAQGTRDGRSHSRAHAVGPPRAMGRRIETPVRPRPGGHGRARHPPAFNVARGGRQSMDDGAPSRSRRSTTSSAPRCSLR